MHSLMILNKRVLIKVKRVNQCLSFLLMSSVFSLFSYSALAANNWQPVISDKLIKLPANVIYQRIESDFSTSPLATELNRVEASLVTSAQQIKELQKLKSKATEQERLALDIDIVEKKSTYVSQLKKSHELRAQALNQRQGLYENVLNKLNQKTSNKKAGSTYQLEKARLAAKARFNKSQQQVQQRLAEQVTPQRYNANTPEFHTRYQQNVDKIAQLKRTLNTHVMNAQPEIDGVSVTDQEYVRSLLIRLSTERSILAQENTMLSYMTKLVALDAENLTATLTKNANNTSFTAPSNKSSTSNYRFASQATELFINGESNE